MPYGQAAAGREPAAGEPSERGGAPMREVLVPHIGEADQTFLRGRMGDGDADIDVRDGGMIANHLSGHDPWACLSRAHAPRTR